VTILETASGRVRGTTGDDGVAVFKGIPYGAAARFAPPRPVAAWTRVRDAVEFGPQAPQVPGFLEQAFGLADWPMSEDCLSLNVWTPAAGRPGAGLPVLVWIHGGAFTNGTGAVPWYDGTAFARRGCVLVTINYRLGALGFTHLADLDGERFAGSGNLGLLDQVAALQWIHDSIVSFGGDPSQVTIFGESAGGASVASLLTCPAATGLFSGAIAESPAFLQLRTRDEATVAAEKYLAALDARPAELVDVPLDRLLAAQQSAFAGPELFTAFAPTADGTVLPAPVIDRLAAGAGADVPFVLGTNRDELYLFTALDGRAASLDDDGLAVVAERHARGDAAALIATYTAVRPGRRGGRRSGRPRRAHVAVPLRLGHTDVRRPARRVPRPGDPVRVPRAARAERRGVPRRRRRAGGHRRRHPRRLGSLRHHGRSGLAAVRPRAAADDALRRHQRGRARPRRRTASYLGPMTSVTS